MPISFRCPSCGHKLRADDHGVGKKARCKCGQVVVVPRAEVSYQPNEAAKPSLREASLLEPSSKPEALAAWWQPDEPAEMEAFGEKLPPSRMEPGQSPPPKSDASGRGQNSSISWKGEGPQDRKSTRLNSSHRL